MNMLYIPKEILKTQHQNTAVINSTYHEEGQFV